MKFEYDGGCHIAMSMCSELSICIRARAIKSKGTFVIARKEYISKFGQD